MSTDIEHIIRGFDAAHELWSSLTEIAIACWLPHGHLGTAFAARLIIIFVSSGPSSLRRPTPANSRGTG